MSHQRLLLAEDIADGDLAIRLKSGSPSAMTDFYERFGAIVYAIALRMVRNTSTAEDLVQETFIRIWNRIELFDRDRGTLASWVAAVTRNRVLDHIRSLDWRMMRAECDLNWVNRHVAPDIAWEEHRLQSPVLIKAFTGLADNHRRVLELAYLEGLSQTEIAVRIQRPVGTIKTWTFAALKSLRTQVPPT
jgi:RNA polymerase sigma-70 factor (ECF subfamily)